MLIKNIIKIKVVFYNTIKLKYYFWQITIIILLKKIKKKKTNTIKNQNSKD